jgi:hypothetical protein
MSDLLLSFSATVSIMALAMGTYVLFRNPRQWISKAFFSVMVLLSLSSVFDYLFLTAASMEVARLMVRPLIFCMVSILGGFLYLATFFSLQSDCPPIARNWKRYALVVLSSGVISALFFVNVQNGDFGWYIPNTLESLGIGLFILVYLGYALYLLNAAYVGSRDPAYGRLASGLTLAMAVPFAYLILISFLELMGYPFSTPIIPACLITSIAFFYAIVRERLFDVRPSDDLLRSRLEPISLKLEEGRSYAVQEKGLDASFRILASELNAGRKGLVISRRHPERIREEYGLMKTPIIWLAHRSVKVSVSPSNLPLLERTITRFMSQGEDTVVLIDGLDRLIMENSSDKAMRFLFAIVDGAQVRRSRPVLSFDPDVMSERDLALLMRDMVVIDHLGAPVIARHMAGPDLPGVVGISLSSHRSA